MTNEQREDVDKLRERFEPDKFGGICALGYKNKYCFGKSDLQAIDTVLSLIKEQEKYIKDANDITEEMNRDIMRLIYELKQKDKQIDLMAEAFKQDDVRTVEEIKQYFASLVEKE